MAEVVIGAGSNLGDRHAVIKKAADYLSRLSAATVRKSSIWESDPVGPAKYPFLNAAAVIHTELSPSELLTTLKSHEHASGRELNPERWSPRILDLDIIAYNSLVIQVENLIIPHPEYHRRLFVLLPLQELFPDWQDPANGTDISTLINKAPDIKITKTEHIW
ncbi:MAG: 2-amino-4-hydroxy-6-hydroxymethyldihydropteridine diphosphokinase [Balneolaceae bacterium]